MERGRVYIMGSRFVRFSLAVPWRARSAGGGAADSTGWPMLSRDHQHNTVLVWACLGSVDRSRSETMR